MAEPSTTKALVLSASAALLVLIRAHAKVHKERRKPYIKWMLSNNKFWQEDERGDEQEDLHVPNTPRMARLSKESFDGAAKCFASSGYNSKLIEERQKTYKLIQNIERIPELDYKPSARYMESTIEKVLHPLIDDAGVILVPGAYFGDEGKGKTVDAIARHPDVTVVARVNSGENAGHTVVSDAGHKYDFHLCPSGLLTPGKVNVIGPECVMDPISFMDREVSQLQKTNVAYKDRLFIGNVHLVCPHHKLLDLIGSWDAPNRSTLMGMGPVHASKASRRGLRLDHLFNEREGPGGARERLERDLQEYFGALELKGVTEKELYAKAKANSKVQPHVLDFIAATDKAAYVLDLFDKVVVNNPDFPPRADVSFMLRETIAKKGKVLLEGPQSYFLSNQAEKFWDSGTSAFTDAAGLLCASRLNLQAGGPGGEPIKPLAINIHKTPGSSRVGSGANPCSFVPQHYFSTVDATKADFEAMFLDWRTVSREYFGSVQKNGLIKPGRYSNAVGTFDLGVAMAAATCIHASHREFGVTSGRPRVVGFFDCVAQAEVMQVQGPYTSISAFDRGDDYDEYGVCVAYVYVHPEGKSLTSNGRVFQSGTIIKAGEQLPTQQILAHCQPIVKTVRGWRDTPIFARSSWWEAQKHPITLPEPVCELIDIIEHFTGTTVISIGNGPRADEIVYIKKATRKPVSPTDRPVKSIF